MKQTSEPSQITYSAPSLVEAVVMAPIMNQLAQRVAERQVYKKWKEMDREERNQYQFPNEGDSLFGIDTEFLYEVLLQIGFVATEEPKAIELKKKQ